MVDGFCAQANALSFKSTFICRFSSTERYIANNVHLLAPFDFMPSQPSVYPYSIDF